MRQSRQRRGIGPLSIVLFLVVALLIGVIFYLALVIPASVSVTTTSTATATTTSTATATTTSTKTTTDTSFQTFTSSTTATVTSVSSGSTTVTVTSTSYTIQTSTLTQTLGTTTTVTTFTNGSIPPASTPFSAILISCSPSAKNCTLVIVNGGGVDAAMQTSGGCASISTGGVTAQSSQCVSPNGGVVPARGTSASITIYFNPAAFQGVSVGQEFAGWIALTNGVQVPLLGTFGQ